MNNRPYLDVRVFRCSGFTLIEMMVVIALVGILIAGVFKLVGIAGQANKRAQTMAKLQKLENAIAGFYSEYGTYPPVPLYDSPDPMKKYDKKTGKYNGEMGNLSEEGAEENAKRAAAAQPVSYAFPCKESEDDDLHHFFVLIDQPDVVSANQVPNAFNGTVTDWQENKAFKFGLLSFLLPRLSIMATFDQNGAMRNGPNRSFFDKQQWLQYNLATRDQYSEQLSRERIACARWIPNFQDIIHGGAGQEILGVRLSKGGENLYEPYDQKGAGKIGLRVIEIRDGWDRPFYYYSAPPYQSYRLWSAGPDGKTFPAGYPLNALRIDDDKKKATGWTKDDIVGFDR